MLLSHLPGLVYGQVPADLPVLLREETLLVFIVDYKMLCLLCIEVVVLIPRGIGELAVHKFQWLDLIFWEDSSLGRDANSKVQDFVPVMTPAGMVLLCIFNHCIAREMLL